jgi:heat shock protein HtpX
MVFRLVGISLFFVAVFAVIGFGIGSLWDSQTAYILCLAFLAVAVMLMAAAYVYASDIILRETKAKPSESTELNGIVEMMAMNAKIPVPRVFVIPNEQPNSMSTGTSRSNAIVCVTQGALGMNRGEIEGIVAHEIRHIANEDIMVQNFAVVVAWLLHKTRLFTPIALAVVRLSLSEGREYAADYYGSRYSGKPRDMATALNKMSGVARQNPIRGSPAFESLWIINPYKREGMGFAFSTHPPTARRTKRLEEMHHEGMPEVPEATEVD